MIQETKVCRLINIYENQTTTNENQPTSIQNHEHLLKSSNINKKQNPLQSFKLILNQLTSLHIIVNYIKSMTIIQNQLKSNNIIK